MKHVNIKNIILIAMVLVCIYLSSNVWLKLPDFFDSDNREADKQEKVTDVNVWNVVKPIKSVIKYKDNYTITYSDNQDVWDNTVKIIKDAFDNFDSSVINESAPFPAQYLKFDFNTSIPVEIFTGNMKIENKHINETIKNIKNIIIDVDNPKSIYIYNGENTVKIENDSINTQEASTMVRQFDFDSATQFAFDQVIAEEKIQVPIPLETAALSPVLVQSELDVFDTDTINQIAKKYFKNNYDYVRKSVEVNGNTVYMYRTEKILKINSEGLLDFYDTTADLKNSSDVYESLVAAINFTEDFLGFPEDVYLNNVESIVYDGSYGYRYTFSYKILEHPILFSKVRENSALQVDVVGDNVISYKRFIRKADESQMEERNEISVLPAIDVIDMNLDLETGSQNYEEAPEIKPLKKDMLNEINNVYLGYFDLSRISKEQLLRVVWVMETQDKTWIFNAMSGKLIEEWQ